jgi:ferredoxin--NADP+ reductase
MTQVRPPPPSITPRWNIIVIGGSPAGLSIAYEAKRAGLDRVLVLEPGDRVTPAAIVGRSGLDVRFQSPVTGIDPRDDVVLIETATEAFSTRVLVDATRIDAPGPPPAIPIAAKLRDRVGAGIDAADHRDLDVLVVGNGERAVAIAVKLEEEGARVVLAFTGEFDSLSRLSRKTLNALELGQRITILWQSEPSAIEEVEGHPMAFFDDRRTPDLQFDRIVFATISAPDTSAHGGRVHVLGRTLLHPAHAFTEITEAYAEEFPPLRPAIDTRRVSGSEEIRDLRREHYNATITHFDHSHEDLWVLRVKPDASDVGHVPGQYATLGLGYWEPRVDDTDEDLTGAKRTKMIRRSYSISSPVFDDRGYLVDPATLDEVEFYIVHVRPDGDRVPALTPRLADKRTGDRIYLGPKITGRYTLAPLSDPFGDVVFMATGTGEAPHNAMISELLRRGHAGQIVSVVTVRYLRDLGYLNVHRRLEERFSNYRYIVLPTREPDHPKRYIQELITSGELADALPHRLAPDATHVFMCGNPKMIGIPEWHDAEPTFPDEVGVCQLLHERGFQLDRRGEIGNVHTEEYW